MMKRGKKKNVKHPAAHVSAEPTGKAGSRGAAHSVPRRCALGTTPVESLLASAEPLAKPGRNPAKPGIHRAFPGRHESSRAGWRRRVNPGQFVGMGIDIVDIRRFRKTLSTRGRRFIDRIFLPSEQKYCGAKPRPWVHYAGRFAAKEAIAKAFGTGIGKELGWLDVEILSSDSKAPIVKLSQYAKRLARRRRTKNILISISHTHNYTAAVALLVS